MVEDVIADGLVVAQVHRAHLVDVQVLGDDRREALNMQSVPKRELELFESSVARCSFAVLFPLSFYSEF